MVTRRFWPLVGGEQAAVSLLAAGLAARGAACTILTYRWRPDWPPQIEHRGIRVVRLPLAGFGAWGALREMQALARWLRRNRATFDLACVSGLRHDACAALWAGQRRRFPVVLRPAGCGLTGDCHWQLDARCGYRIKRMCMRADAFVSPTSAIHRELIAAGYPRDRLRHIPCGVPPAEPRTEVGRHAARLTLSQAHPALGSTENSPIAVYTGRLHPAKGLEHLVAAWPIVLARQPQARLWLVGEGPEAAALNERVRARGLAASIILPGAFDPVDDFLAAADLYVQPAIEDGTNLGLLEALAAGLPVVASDLPGHRDLIEHLTTGLLVPAEQPDALAAAILRALENRGEAAARAEAARQRTAREFTVDRMVEEHLALFQALLQSDV
jgi:glycosyltransferase involved in cell wall biosynthesis